MQETDEVGNKHIAILIREIDSGNFNEWEHKFITDLKGKKYQTLSKREKAVVTRLINWLSGGQ